MAGWSTPKRVVGKKGGISWKTVVDVGDDPATGKRKQKKLTAATKPELEKMAAKLLADVANNGVYFEPSKQTFGEYLSYWLETYGKPNLGIRTLREYKSIIDKQLKPSFLGSLPLKKLIPSEIQRFYSEALVSGRKDGKKSKSGGLTGNTVLHFHKVINESLSHAVKWELIVRNPADKVKPPKKERVEIETLTKPEVKAMRQATKGTYAYMPTVISLGTTMREGECLGLSWTNIHFKEKYLSVTQTLKEVEGVLHLGPPKSEHSRRRIDLSPELIAELKALKVRQAEEKLAAGPAYQNDDNLVCTMPDGSKIVPSNLSSYWSDIAKRVLGRDAHFHMIRHTTATALLEAGEPIKRVSEMLGHGSIAITGDTYGHVTPAGRKHAAETLGRAMFGDEE